MKRLGRHSMAVIAYRLILAGLVLLAALPAVLVGLVGYATEHQRAQATALAIGWVAERQPDMTGEHSLDDDLAQLAHLPTLDVTGETREIIDPAGRLISRGGDPRGRDWPSVVATQELHRHAEHIGSLHVTRTLQPTLGRAAALALLCSVLALALWTGVFMRPMGLLRRAERRMRDQAHHDALTGLHNREGLRLRLRNAIAHCEGTFRTVAVLVIDLDRFRIVNDSLGQPAGDALLCGVADRIRAVTRPGDGVARLGADQFAIVVEGIAGAQAAAGMARNLLRALEPAYLLDGQEAVASLSIGVAVFSDHANSVDALLTGADAAMRLAKGEGGGRFKLYEATMDANAQQRLDLEQSLRRALQLEQLFLLYQPIMDASGERVVAIEALLRWADPQRGTVSPAEFVPIMEQTGLIIAAGRWALHEACRMGAAWHAAGVQDMLMSVNVSPRQFAEPDFVTMVQTVLRQTGFPAEQLQLEVTEGLLLDPTAEGQAKIEALVGLGVRLALDDFGMGYSSLAYLKRFKLHTLKIDRMFVRDIATEAQDSAIVRAIIDLGHGLGMRVTAEGVETEAQFQELRRLGCDSLQGFLFAQPEPERVVMARVKERDRAAGPAMIQHLVASAAPARAGAGRAARPSETVEG